MSCQDQAELAEVDLRFCGRLSCLGEKRRGLAGQAGYDRCVRNALMLASAQAEHSDWKPDDRPFLSDVVKFVWCNLSGVSNTAWLATGETPCGEPADDSRG